MKIIILILIFMALSFYIWATFFYKEGNDIGIEGMEEVDNGLFTTDKVSTGISQIDRYQDPDCSTNEYIYCVDGQIECDDILGGSVNSLSKLDKYDYGDTFNGCDSYINKINLADYQDKTTGVSNTRGVYFDLSLCTQDKPWRVDVLGRSFVQSDCYSTELDAVNEWDKLTATTAPILTFNFKDKVLIDASSSVWEGRMSLQPLLDSKNANGTIKRMNGRKYYKGVILQVTDTNYIIDVGLGIDIEKHPEMLLFIPKNINGISSLVMIKDSAFNIYANDYYSDLVTGSHKRPICKKGVFTSCLSKPPFKIDNGKYVRLNPTTILDNQEKSSNGSNVIDQVFKPSGIIDTSNILESNYYESVGLQSNPFIKCIANYSSKIGDPVCCGQDAKVKDTKHLCPAEMPTCLGYSLTDNLYGICT